MKRLRYERKARKRDGETKRQNKQDKEREGERWRNQAFRAIDLSKNNLLFPSGG